MKNLIILLFFVSFAAQGQTATSTPTVMNGDEIVGDQLFLGSSRYTVIGDEYRNDLFNYFWKKWGDIPGQPIGGGISIRVNRAHDAVVEGPSSLNNVLFRFREADDIYTHLSNFARHNYGTERIDGNRNTLRLYPHPDVFDTFSNMLFSTGDAFYIYRFDAWEIGYGSRLGVGTSIND